MKLSLLLMRQSWKHSDEPVTPLHQKRLESLMTVSPLTFPLSRFVLVVVAMVTLPLVAVAMVTWLDWRPVSEEDKRCNGFWVDQVSKTVTAHVRLVWIIIIIIIINCIGSGEQEIKLHCLDVQLSYNNEFLGCKRLPVFSTRTNNYIISLSQVWGLWMYMYSWMCSYLWTYDYLFIGV